MEGNNDTEPSVNSVNGEHKPGVPPFHPPAEDLAESPPYQSSSLVPLLPSEGSSSRFTPQAIPKEGLYCTSNVKKNVDQYPSTTITPTYPPPAVTTGNLTGVRPRLPPPPQESVSNFWQRLAQHQTLLSNASHIHSSSQSHPSLNYGATPAVRDETSPANIRSRHTAQRDSNTQRPVSATLLQLEANAESILLERANAILSQDQSQFYALQENAMKSFNTFEIEQDIWLDQLKSNRNMSQKAADKVAQVGGSWGFVIGLISFIATWAIVNKILSVSTENGAWDPYPFILLNLFLSMIAAIQAPIIMMSQNRQQEQDRKEARYISQRILRNEHLTRHVNAKLDYLLSGQMKSLMELEEIQMDLISLGFGFHHSKMDSQSVRSVGGTTTMNIVATLEFREDPHIRALLSALFFKTNESFIFAHWHMEGDNYSGTIEDISIDMLPRGSLLLRYDIVFPTVLATLDDIFSGESSVFLRNDFHVAGQNMKGRILSIAPTFRGETKAREIKNGQLPTRFIPTFAIKRHDRISELWKTHFHRIAFRYEGMFCLQSLAIPPPGMKEVNCSGPLIMDIHWLANAALSSSSSPLASSENVIPATNPKYQRVLFRKKQPLDDFYSVLQDMIGTSEQSTDGWKTLYEGRDDGYLTLDLEPGDYWLWCYCDARINVVQCASAN